MHPGACIARYGLLLLIAAPPAMADGLRGSLTLTSDYVQRGISQNDGNAALQASLAYWNPTGWYAGGWASMVDTANRYYPSSKGANAEVDLFAGFGRRLGEDWVLDTKAVGYFYPDDPAPVSYDYLELVVSLAWRERFYASVAATPRMTWRDYYGGLHEHAAFNYELSAQRPLTQWFTWMIGAGYHQLGAPNVSGYVYGSTSLVMQLNRVTFELGYYSTQSKADHLFGERLAASRGVLTATYSF